MKRRNIKVFNSFIKTFYSALSDGVFLPDSMLQLMIPFCPTIRHHKTIAPNDINFFYIHIKTFYLTSCQRCGMIVSRKKDIIRPHLKREAEERKEKVCIATMMVYVRLVDGRTFTSPKEVRFASSRERTSPGSVQLRRHSTRSVGSGPIPPTTSPQEPRLSPQVPCIGERK